MPKVIIHLLFAAGYGLLLFFGIGPVLLADGSDSERYLTLATVIALLAVLFGIHRWAIARMKGRKAS